MGTKTLNQWLQQLGYKWVGEEGMYKGFYTRGEAEQMVSKLIAYGEIKSCQN